MIFSKSCMPIGYFIIVLQTYDILCRKTIIRYVVSYPSKPPTKLPLLPPSSLWRGCSRTPFGRRSRCSGFVEINHLFKVINSYNRVPIFWIVFQPIREILNHPFFFHPGNGGSGSGLYGYIGFGIPMHEPNG